MAGSSTVCVERGTPLSISAGGAAPAGSTSKNRETQQSGVSNTGPRLSRTS
jgi:hypothetical protein